LHNYKFTDAAVWRPMQWGVMPKFYLTIEGRKNKAKNFFGLY